MNVEVICTYCKTIYLRAKKDHNRYINKGQKNFYCSTLCRSNARRIHPKTISFKCAHCKQLIEKKFDQSNKYKFCSTTCSNMARSTGRKFNKRCKTCNKISKIEVEACRDCAVVIRNQRTLQDIKNSVNSLGAYHAKLRGLARVAYKSYGGKLECLACGYKLHADVCHIKDVQDFPMTATLAEVNAKENLIALDKRCHWEFDHGYLKLSSQGSVTRSTRES